MAEHDLPVIVLDVLVVAKARGGLGEDGGQRGLADLKRLAPQVVTVNSIRSKPYMNTLSSCSVPEPIEARRSIVVAGGGLSVDTQARPRLEPVHRLDE